MSEARKEYKKAWREVRLVNHRMQDLNATAQEKAFDTYWNGSDAQYNATRSLFELLSWKSLKAAGVGRAFRFYRAKAAKRLSMGYLAIIIDSKPCYHITSPLFQKAAPHEP